MAEDTGIDYQSDVQKAQMIRLWDIFFISPALIIIGFLPNIPLLARIILIGIGIGTFVYNGTFYIKYKK